MIFISLQAKKNLNFSKGTSVKAGSHQDILVAATSAGHWTCRRMCQCDQVSLQLPSSRQVSLLQEETIRLSHTCDVQVEGKFSGLH